MTYYLKIANAFVPLSISLFLMLGSNILHSENSKINLLLEELKYPIERSNSEVEKEIWSEWSKSGSKSLDLLFQRGRYHMINRNTEHAIEIFNIVIDKNPTFAEAWNARATAYYLQGKFNESISDINQVLSLNSSHFGALSGLGAIFETLGYFDEALEAFTKAGEINPLNQNINKSIQRLMKKVDGASL